MKTRILLVATASAIFAFAANTASAVEVLDDAQCDAAWTMASPHGDAISKDQATPYVIDYTMVDSDADGTISAEEFKKGCAAGAVKAANDAQTKEMEGK